MMKVVSFVVVGLAAMSLSIGSTGAAAADPAPVAVKAPKETAELLAKGKAAFNVSCLVCHGEKGDGNGPAGAAMNPKPRDFTKEAFKNGYKPEEVFASISNGVKDTAMVAFAHLSEEERWGLSYYVLTMVPAELKNPPKGKKGAAPAKK